MLEAFVACDGQAPLDPDPEVIQHVDARMPKDAERPGDAGRAEDAQLGRVVHDDGVGAADAEVPHGAREVSS